MLLMGRKKLFCKLLSKKVSHTYFFFYDCSVMNIIFYVFTEVSRSHDITPGFFFVISLSTVFNQY